MSPEEAIRQKYTAARAKLGKGHLFKNPTDGGAVGGIAMVAAVAVGIIAGMTGAAFLPLSIAAVGIFAGGVRLASGGAIPGIMPAKADYDAIGEAERMDIGEARVVEGIRVAATSPEWSIRGEAMSNPRCPADVLQVAATSDPVPLVRAAAMDQIALREKWASMNADAPDYDFQNGPGAPVARPRSQKV